MSSTPEITVGRDGHVALIEMHRPPHNFINPAFMQQLADTLEALDRDDGCRAVVLASGLRTFCAGADFSGAENGTRENNPGPFYAQAMRLFGTAKPIIAAVNGPAIGAGLGLAVAADFRVASPEARFSANFTRLGFHPGFGLSLTLPRLIGTQKAALLMYTGRRIDGAQALALGLVDELANAGDVRSRAMALAQEIAHSSPLAVESTRATLRKGLHAQVVEANRHELAVQAEQFRTADFREGVAAMAQRREPVFHRG